ncbi:cell wall-binding repeat-containing protein [Clostridium cylindrosporum]|uniref:Putative lipoprotein n=1 Tax=Clostridium cylindrosporum DSM 605 TaxID=1121307 RepID=A0A0J8G6K8_CLOCY|nr:cell wall-binding repeat-containing protein [Clostridium cylindrosporum]KMT23241.1 putative lipoprotein [Clostridium cylindrosporum DSM 605]
MNNYLDSCPLTLNTTRICGDNPINTAIEVSKIGFSNMKPNAVILVNKDEVFDGIAASSLVHFPINAVILFTNGNKLSKETLCEIMRLSPKSYKGIQVILVGNVSRSVSDELNHQGFTTQHIAGRNHYETSCKIPSERKKFKNILVVSGEDYSEGIMTSYWSAHHGDPILYVQKNKIPTCTKEIIRKMNDINIYIIGSTKTVSRSVEKSLSELRNVKNVCRIDGDTPYDIAINFSKFKDDNTEFGWGRNYREGHAFTFGTLNHPMETISGALFAHMGKHTPLLLIKDNIVPFTVERYIKSIKPIHPKDMPKPPFMHGYIIGDTSDVSYSTQVAIESLLSIDHEMMDMENKDEIKHMMNHSTSEEQKDMKHHME